MSSSRLNLRAVTQKIGKGRTFSRKHEAKTKCTQTGVVCWLCRSVLAMLPFYGLLPRDRMTREKYTRTHTHTNQYVYAHMCALGMCKWISSAFLIVLFVLSGLRLSYLFFHFILFSVPAFFTGRRTGKSRKARGWHRMDDFSKPKKCSTNQRPTSVSRSMKSAIICFWPSQSDFAHCVCVFLCVCLCMSSCYAR